MEEMGEASVESDEGQEEATQKGGKGGKKHKKNKKNKGALREVNNWISYCVLGAVRSYYPSHCSLVIVLTAAMLFACATDKCPSSHFHLSLNAVSAWYSAYF